jgi:hypothetical protein
LLTQLRESIVIILRMTPFDTYQLPAVEGWWLASYPIDKLVVEQKL